MKQAIESLDGALIVNDVDYIYALKEDKIILL